MSELKEFFRSVGLSDLYESFGGVQVADKPAETEAIHLLKPDAPAYVRQISASHAMGLRRSARGPRSDAEAQASREQMKELLRRKGGTGKRYEA